MPDIKKTETVSITYGNDKITVVGKTFNITLDVASSELFSIYMGNKGKGNATLTVHMPEEQPKPVEVTPAPTPTQSTAEVKPKPTPAPIVENKPDSKHVSATKTPSHTSDFQENGGTTNWWNKTNGA